MSDASNAFASFMAGPFGRGLRIVIGLAMMAWGGSQKTGILGPFVLVAGLAPILAGLFNVCLISPLIGAPFRGREARERVHARPRHA